MDKPKGHVDQEYLKIVGENLRQLKELTYKHMKIETGHKVLDVGCGPGTDTIPLAKMVGSSGEVRGVDFDKEMIAEAQKSAKESGVSDWVDHKKADAAQLPFATNRFDANGSERLFQHLINPEEVLAEMARVTKQKGWVVVLDTDWGSIGIDTSEIELERRFFRFGADHQANNGYAGRQLYRLFKQEGFTNITVKVLPVILKSYAVGRHMLLFDKIEKGAIEEKVITEEELQRLNSNFEEADAAGRFFCFGCMMLVSGQKD